MKKLLMFLLTFAFSAFGCATVGVAAGFDPAVSIGVGMGLGAFVQLPQGVATMGIQREVWANYIVGNLFKDNEFLNYCFNEDAFVINGVLVHIPQAGAVANVKRNRTNLPATITQRQDIDITYALDEFTTDPKLIVNAEMVELSYDKISSVLQEEVAGLKQVIADWILYKWSPAKATSIIRTTGSNMTANLPGATGNRKKVLAVDIQAIRTKFNKDNVPKEDRYLIMSSDMYNSLLEDLGPTHARQAIMDVANLPEGVIDRYMGFNIMERSSVVAYSNAATPAAKTPDANTATTDNDTCLAYQKLSVAKAFGTTDFFERLNDPQFYGNVYSALQRMGGRIRRADEKGIVALVQGQ